jgi:hypothetical protein
MERSMIATPTERTQVEADRKSASRKVTKVQRRARKIARGGKPIARHARSGRRREMRHAASVASRSAWLEARGLSSKPKADA